MLNFAQANPSLDYKAAEVKGRVIGRDPSNFLSYLTIDLGSQQGIEKDMPVVTVAGQLVAMSMEGSIAVEVVFNRQGIGWWLAESAVQLDIPVLMCICLFMGVVFVITNLTLDILYAYIDPRIRLN